MTGQEFGLDGDFTAAYLAVRRVADLAGQDPGAVAPHTVAALEGLLARNDHARQTQARILYRDAAGVLVTLLADGPPVLATASRLALDRALTTPGKPRLAAAEAVGGLPLCIRGPHPDLPPLGPVPYLSFADLVRRAGADGRAVRFAGRSLLAPTHDPNILLVVKRLRRGEDPAGLCREAAWMEFCAGLPFPVPCHVPRPLKPDGSPLVAVPDAPRPPGASGQDLDPDGLCLASLAHSHYFVYPNDPPPHNLDADAFVAVMGRAALLLGWLAGQGILHEAAIPLFHNRVQLTRREDGGVYDWRLPGRLDRWLESARHPNFGLSGLRDFEHCRAVADRTSVLYREMGNHFMSLFLVAGSYFRMRDPALVGRTASNDPVDARRLFDEDLLVRVVDNVFVKYHEGFVGKAPAGPPFCARSLARRMVEEMGVDRHMEELVRVADQEAMTDQAFVEFLVSRGMALDAAQGLRRGAVDVALATGPHLGAFNDRTSLPELGECTAAATAACLTGRYFQDRGRN